MIYRFPSLRQSLVQSQLWKQNNVRNLFKANKRHKNDGIVYNSQKINILLMEIKIYYSSSMKIPENCFLTKFNNVKSKYSCQCNRFL